MIYKRYLGVKIVDIFGLNFKLGILKKNYPNISYE